MGPRNWPTGCYPGPAILQGSTWRRSKPAVTSAPGSRCRAAATGSTCAEGKTLLDATNAVTQAGDLVYPNSSLAEHLQAALPAVHVVKSLNTAAIEVQADPSLVGPATVFVSGDNEAAKTEVKGLLHDLGWKDPGIIDLGGIKTARGPENYIVLFFETIGVLNTPFFNIHITR